jgi:hypothetical protein
LFALGIVKTIRESGIHRQKNPSQNLSNKGFGAFGEIA